ncbi:hypothetical protein SSYM_0229 [Serratia symbiotica str. Tucson]|uniref:Uncharacterized protein n=2 Tax=Serratia symbiotica TaxID=138074 RepID=E9CQQ7_9GAMM|nr:hypothetical protein [Serratia symbiotica]EFW11114.1 hypothetical protein SSYM_0229 [Serratia symbiotica str. Tucson]BBI92749.1 uncharacterized protein SSYIS1_26220 [Serratia symbiotica]
MSFYQPPLTITSRILHDQALNASKQKTDCAPLVECMLEMILQALEQSLTPQVTELLAVLRGEMALGAIQNALQL